MSKTQGKIKIYWELLRGFTLFAPFTGILSGAFVALIVAGLNIDVNLFLKIFLAGIAAAFLNGASNAINQYYDIEIDRINKPERPLVRKIISTNEVLIAAFIIYLFSIVMAFFASFNPWQTLVLYLLATILTIIYSVPPIRAKRLTWGSNLTIAVARGLLLIVAGWSLVSSVFNIEPWLLGFVFGVFIFFAASTKDLGDIKGDEKFNIKTIPVVFGIRFANKFISLGFIVPFLLLFLLSCFNMLSANSMLVIFLSLMLLCWGLYIAYCLNKSLINSQKLWRQMYYIMMALQIGIILVYYLSYKFI